MNLSNKNIFDLYIALLEVNNKKKVHFSKKIRSLIIYILTGYIIKRYRNRNKINELNNFKETSKKYENTKLVIYTVVSGKYDIINEPIFCDENIDYYVFTDQNVSKTSVWKKISFTDINIEHLSPLEQAWYVKTHPHKFFKDYDCSMFIDGNIKLTCDVKPLFYSLLDSGKNMAVHRHQCRDCVYEEGIVVITSGRVKFNDVYKQIKYYKKEKFPKHFGLFETNVLIRNHNNPLCIQVMEDWWKQIKKFSKRDQLSFTYVLWKQKLTSNDVLSLGNNSRRNPKKS